MNEEEIKKQDLKKKRVTIFLDEIEEKKVKDLLLREGGSMPQLFKYCFNTVYNKTFPSYSTKIKVSKPIKAPEPELTVEQLCESAGGKIVKNPNGTSYCEILIYESANGKGRQTQSIPLEQKDLKKYIKKNK